ncbi:MAG: TonB-dependent receptor [Luteitalea sp.]|nr:TonB-dependent receptor [Luteitalea sp.]
MTRFSVVLPQWIVALPLVAIALFTPAASEAQSAAGIAGVVKDTTGAVLPGVTVEASSSALIEKVRTVVTDGEGLYRILDLRPGAYTVTFTLPGFNTVRREGLDLSSSFTATVNAEMRVGSLEETITVSGQASTVDIQNVVQQRVITRDVMDEVPVGTKTISAMGALIPGMVANTQDVGGTGGTSSAQISIHNSRGGEEQLLQDGMTYNTGNGRGGAFSSVRANEASTQEIAIETGGLGAESELSGVRTNVIPKEGGNSFRSYTNFRYGNHTMQSNNMSDDLRSRGLSSPDSLDFVVNFTQGFGGPIMKDKLWFYTAFQILRSDTRMGGLFYNLTPDKPVYTPDLSRPALDGQNEGDGNLRFTWQINPKHKLNLFHQLDFNLRHHWYQGGCGPLASPEACYTDRVIPTYFSQVVWNSPVTNRLLLEAGAVLTKRNFVQGYPGTLGHDEGLGTPFSAYSYTENRTGFTWGQWRNPIGFNDSYQWNTRLAVSYVTGSHAAKFGFTVYHAGNLNTQEVSGNGVTLQLLDGVPRQVTQWATPLRFEETMKANIGVFAQDQWTVNRLTLNLGVRYDFQNMEVPENELSPGPNVPNRRVTFDPVPDVTNWKNVTPRLGGAYDLFGNGRTALKASVGKYLEGPNLNTYAGRANPARGTRTSTTRLWNDVNGDFLPQCDFVALTANGECAAVQNPDFGGSISQTRLSDEARTNRGYNWEVSTSVQQELRQNVSLNVGYFRRWYGNLITTDNELVTAANYDPYCITAPRNPSLPDGGGYQVCGLYDITPALRSATDNVIKLAKTFGTQTEVYNGVDVSVNARLPAGLLLAGGTSTGRVVTDACFVVDSPQGSAGAAAAIVPGLLNCRISPPFQTQFKGIAVFPLPWWGLQTSGSFQSIPPPQITANYTATNAEIAPSLGRTISPGAGGTIASIPLVEPGTIFGDRLNQVDFRIAKTFRPRAGKRVQLFYDIYNLLNANPVLAYNTNFSTAGPPRTVASRATYDWPVPTTILQGRLTKVGVQLDW